MKLYFVVVVIVVEPAQAHKNYQQNDTQNTCSNNNEDLR
jgi:hypothetical protein